MKFLEDYNQVAKILHWLMAVMIISLFAVGIYMHDLPKDDALRPTLYMLHKASGMLVLFLVVIRLLWRLTHKPPSLDRYSGLVKKAASISHFSLYVLMFAIPLSGFFMSTAGGHPVNFFGLFEFPLLFDKNKELGKIFSETHEILAFVLIGIVLLHVAGAIKHRLGK